MDTHKVLNCFCHYCMCIVGWQVDTLQNDDFTIGFQIPLPSKMIKSKVIYKMEANDRKQILKKLQAVQFQAVLCVQPSMYMYVTWVWKTILNHSFHVFRNVSLKRFNLLYIGYMFNYICWEGMKLHMNNIQHNSPLIQLSHFSSLTPGLIASWIAHRFR